MTQYAEHQFPTEFSPESRVWIYQADRELSDQEADQIGRLLQEFTASWVSHNRQLLSTGALLYNRFVVLMVDESRADASGCSIDKSVHFLKQLEEQFGISLFERMTFAWLDQAGSIWTADRDEFARMYMDGRITAETLVFDHLVSTRQQFEEEWVKPLQDSWHKRMV
jgi:hypothetical protein